MTKTFYIPWFWNTEDYISKNYIWKEEKIISQKNLRVFSNTRLTNLIENISKDTLKILYKKVIKSYDINKNIRKKVDLYNFKWFTRNIDLTTKLTLKELDKIDYIDKFIWHSQWWFVLILSILEKPEILEKIWNIELLAPVINSKIAKDFHIWKEKSYLHPKNLVVRKEYIESFNKYNNNIFNDFLELLKNKNWKWKVKLMIWWKDDIIRLDMFDLEYLKEINFLDIEIIENWDHYLWFKKK